MAKTYEGSPCPKGHTTRYVSNGKCVECQREYQREYRRRPEVKAKKRERYGRRYRSDPKFKAKRREYRQKTKRRDRGQTTVPIKPPAVCEWPGCDKATDHNGRSLDEDHCHDTGSFRGHLCLAHNRLLGMMGDNKIGVQKSYEDAIAYLEMAERRHEEYGWITKIE